MKITKIEKEGNVYSVTFTPNIIKKLLGVKETTERFLETQHTFKFGSDIAFLREDGSYVENFSKLSEALNNFKRKW